MSSGGDFTAPQPTSRRKIQVDRMYGGSGDPLAICDGVCVKSRKPRGSLAAMSREFAFPGTRPKFAPDRVVDLQHIALVLDVDPAQRSLSGSVTLRGSVLAPGTRAIELDAVELQIDVVTV